MESHQRWRTIGREAVGSLHSDQFDLLQAFLEAKQTLKIVLEDERIDEVECGRERGLALSAVEGHNTNFFCYTTPEDCRDDLAEIRRLLDVTNEKNGINSTRIAEETALTKLEAEAILHQMSRQMQNPFEKSRGDITSYAIFMTIEYGSSDVPQSIRRGISRGLKTITRKYVTALTSNSETDWGVPQAEYPTATDSYTIERPFVLWSTDEPTNATQRHAVLLQREDQARTVTAGDTGGGPSE